MNRTLSIVIPVYNERDLLPICLDAVRRVELPAGLQRRIVLIDDCSTDGTAAVVDELASRYPDVTALHHPVNRGKGAALRTGFEHVLALPGDEQDIVLIQDADLEYAPSDYPALLQPILDDEADAVYGSRFISHRRRVLYFWHAVGNQVLTLLSNMLSNLNLTDMECCYKLITRGTLQQLAIEEDRFGVEPEITAKLAKLRARIFEVPVRYNGRTYDEGKKIGWRDGVAALRCIARYNLRRSVGPRPRIAIAAPTLRRAA